MKMGYVLIATACLAILTSCTPNGCTYPTACWKGYFRETPCGTYITSPCEKVCDHCTFNDPACQACWTCVKQDGCGYGTSCYDIRNWR
jgi:hypothetical protein